MYTVMIFCNDFFASKTFLVEISEPKAENVYRMMEPWLGRILLK